MNITAYYVHLSIMHQQIKTHVLILSRQKYGTDNQSPLSVKQLVLLSTSITAILPTDFIHVDIPIVWPYGWQYVNVSWQNSINDPKFVRQHSSYPLEYLTLLFPYLHRLSQVRSWAEQVGNMRSIDNPFMDTGRLRVFSKEPLLKELKNYLA
jgi:hypothetical protein